MKIEINPSVSYKELHGEVIPSNIEAGLYYCIGGTGKQIRESLLQGQEAANIIESLVEQHIRKLISRN